MQLVADDLLCPACSGYVHAFLDRCPACGTERAGRLDDAIAHGRIGAADLLADVETRTTAHQVAMRYSLRSLSSGLAAGSISELDAAFALVARALNYRAAVAVESPTPATVGATPATVGATPAGPGETATLDGARVGLAGGHLVVRAGPTAKPTAEIPLDGILAATPVVKGRPAPDAWAGAQLGGRTLVPRRLLAGGDLLVTFAAGGSAGQLTLANPRGFFASSAKPEHYVVMARWLAILGAAACEEVWVARGALAHAAELGFGPAGSTAGVTAGVTPDVTAGGDIGRSSEAVPATGVRAALQELEALRTGGLVSEVEYAAKRQEILARL